MDQVAKIGSLGERARAVVEPEAQCSPTTRLEARVNGVTTIEASLVSDILCLF